MLQLRAYEHDLEESRELNFAVTKNNVHLLSELLAQPRYKEVIDIPCGWGIPETPLINAASKGFVECLKILLNCGADVNRYNVKAQSPMFMAVREGHLECVQELLKAGVNPNRSIFNRFSSVQVAAMKGNDRILVELLNYGGEINMRLKPSDIPETIRTSHGPLFIAVVYSHLNCFKTLLLYGSDPDYNCPDLELLQMLKKPRTIMEMCLKSGQRAPFVKLLIEFGANMHLIDDCVIKQIMYNEALEVFLQGKARPRTLMSQCRLSIRKHLRHVRKMTLIHQLDVPQELIRYLKHET